MEFQARITKLYRLLAEQLCIIDCKNGEHWKISKFGHSITNFVGFILGTLKLKSGPAGWGCPWRHRGIVYLVQDIYFIPPNQVSFISQRTFCNSIFFSNKSFMKKLVFSKKIKISSTFVRLALFHLKKCRDKSIYFLSLFQARNFTT